MYKESDWCCNVTQQDLGRNKIKINTAVIGHVIQHGLEFTAEKASKKCHYKNRPNCITIMQNE